MEPGGFAYGVGGGALNPGQFNGTLEDMQPKRFGTVRTNIRHYPRLNREGLS